MLVHIPGRSTVARTDSTGDFVLSNVPVGTHDVVFELAGEVIHTEADVNVLDQLGTDLGFLDICPDVDGDGFDVTLDCDDTDFDINPDATEVCDSVDNDCDGTIDEGGVCGGCIDVDLDGFCANVDDCNDDDDTVFPGAPELCDGLDNDCDGTIDDGLAILTFYRDDDGDGFGDATVTVEACAAPFGFVADNTDCNDSESGVNPGAAEICNGIDDDCNAQVDDNVPGTGVACDGDDTDLCKEGITFCDPVIGDIFCNDTSGNDVEICNNVDDDCDGLIDEGGVCD